jgi:hypothetical protein
MASARITCEITNQPELVENGKTIVEACELMGLPDWLTRLWIKDYLWNHLELKVIPEGEQL